jgi:flagellar biosynthetic protein FliR
VTDLLTLVARLEAQLSGFVLVWVRLGALLLVAPLPAPRGVPTLHRVGLATLLAAVLAPVVPSPPALGPGWLGLGLAVAGEVAVGLLMGSLVAWALAAVESAGEVAGLQMGVGLAGVLDPTSGRQTNPVARWLELTAILFALAVNGHHLVLEAAAASFDRLPPGRALSPAAAGGAVALGAAVLRSALDLAAPVIGVALLVQAAAALLGRVAPQTNVYLLAVPAVAVLGLAVLAAALPRLGPALGRLLGDFLGAAPALLTGGGHGIR